ncbi:MAG: hypothetical protein KME32_34930 [Mojavia pulchra JT2-VF2]|jgi:hypothetical protein|uniref:Uncharacterized protein n=1 Tax=Mojavia pulchra JT2-VF2 TaxID=287848 RepID=A0A951ULD3_9NOST|nr:hypothetical protein [Mojavia pulchra JT2-VF2]
MPDGKPFARLRIRRLQENCQLEAPAQEVLKCLEKLKRPYLTKFEEKLLSFIEQECDKNE